MNELDEILDRLSNPSNIKSAAQEKNRPGWRFPASHFKADITGKGSDIQIETRRPEGSQYDDTGYFLDLNITEVYSSRPGFQPGTYRLWIQFPRFPSGDYPDKDFDSENARMMLAANESDPTIKSPRDLPGHKGVEFTEETYDFVRWSRAKGDQDKTTYFYRMKFSGPATNGASAPAAGPTEAAVARALELVRESGEDGISETEFRLTASRDPLIKGDRAMVKWLTSGTITVEHPEVGRVDDRLVWIGVD